MRTALVSLLLGVFVAVVAAAAAFAVGAALSSKHDGWEVFDGIAAAVVIGPLAGIGTFVVTLLLRVTRDEEGEPEEPPLPVARASFARRSAAPPVPGPGPGRARAGVDSQAGGHTVGPTA